MEKMNDLKDLFKHEIQDLYSAEEQIIEALPKMIEKASNPQLKKALQNHLDVTRRQLSRLEQVQNMIGEGETGEEKGLLSRLFKGRQVCKGTEGLIEEGEKIMSHDMNQEVLDAAIIASCQKLEHYEICGYGTARTYARELNMEEVAVLLEQTLNEEYEADDLLTQLAVTRVNLEAENGAASGGSDRAGRVSKRNGASERVRAQEPEMEMVSDKGRSGAAKKTSSSARGGNAPKGEAISRTTASSGRSTSANKKGTTNASNSKSSKKNSGRSNGRSSSGGRGSNSGRGRS